MSARGGLAGWHRLDLQELRRGLAGYGLWNLVCLCGLVFAGAGQGIGGLLSFAAVSVLLGGLEAAWFRRGAGVLAAERPSAAQLNWARYADDLAAFSRCLWCPLKKLSSLFHQMSCRCGLNQGR
jgi:hypothetical protein